ncbi:hypothetical protein ACWC4C_33320 [Streptomyces olivaceoviridis]
MTGPGPYRPPRYKPRGWGEELRRRQHNAGMTAWELAGLLSVHEHALSLDHLPNQPLHVVLELARRLELRPSDLTPYAAEVYHHPRYFDAQFPTEPVPGTDTDAVALLNALAHAGRPLTADFLAESLGWGLDRVSDAIERAWAYPHLAGPCVDPTVEALAKAAVTSADQDPARGSAGAHLHRAWAAAYALHPDPVRAYSEAIKAVEAAAHATVEPDNRKATLGSMIKVMQNTRDRWVVGIGHEPSSAGAETVERMMRLLWTGQTS